MSNAGNHFRTGASSSSLVRLEGASYMHSVIQVLLGAVLNCPDGYVCKRMGCFFFKLTVVIEGFSITSLGHTTLVTSVVFFFIPVPAFLVGMALSGSWFV